MAPRNREDVYAVTNVKEVSPYTAVHTAVHGVAGHSRIRKMLVVYQVVYLMTV